MTRKLTLRETCSAWLLVIAVITFSTIRHFAISSPTDILYQCSVGFLWLSYGIFIAVFGYICREAGRFRWADLYLFGLGMLLIALMTIDFCQPYWWNWFMLALVLLLGLGICVGEKQEEKSQKTAEEKTQHAAG